MIVHQICAAHHRSQPTSSGSTLFLPVPLKSLGLDSICVRLCCLLHLHVLQFAPTLSGTLVCLLLSSFKVTDQETDKTRESLSRVDTWKRAGAELH